MPSGIGNIRRIDLKSSLRAIKDTKNFQVEKTGRFTCRFFEFAFNLVLIGMASTMLSGKPGTPGDVGQSMKTVVILLAVSGLMGSLWNFIMYCAPWLSKKWTSKRILLIETMVDGIFCLFWIVAFICLCVEVAPQCPPGTSKDCDHANWTIVFSSMVTFTWCVSFTLDGLSLYEGVYKQGDINPEILLEIHRSSRNPR